MARTVLLAAAVLACTGCKTVPGLSAAMAAQLEGTPHAYLSGAVGDLHQVAMLNNKDFVYSVALSPDAQRAALSHLGPKNFQVALWSLEATPRLIADPSVNHHQWDVESVAFSPDGKVVAAVSRDGGVRLFAADSGLPLGAYATDEPLVAVAFHPSGRYFAVGSARGLVTVLSFPALRFSFEQRAHQGEVRALEFTAAGVLYSGGWDKSILPFDTLEEAVSPDSARLRFERRGGFSIVRGTVSDKVSAAFVLDARQPYVIVKTEVAKTAGIDLALLPDTVTIQTPLGQALVRVAKDQTLSFKSLTVSGVEVAVCDACVPGDAQGVLGESFTKRFEVSFDEAAGEVLLAAKEKIASAEPRQVLSLKPRKRLTFEWFVNDFSLDRAGRSLGVAFSEEKAERNREVYEREKKGLPEPKREGNAGAIVDAQTGAILHRWNRHQGVVATAALSPDGMTLATGGWDKRVLVNRPGDLEPLERDFGWSVRRVRFSEDGRLLAIGAWTPQNPLGDQTSNPSAVIYEVRYQRPEVQGGVGAEAR